MSRIFFLIATDVILAIWAMAAGTNPYFFILMIIWMHYMFYAFHRLESHVLLFAFGIPFFVFLIGREFLEQYNLFEPDDVFSARTNEHAYICMILSLLSVWGMYVYCVKKWNASTRFLYNNKGHDIIADGKFNIERIRRLSLFAFYSTYPFAIVSSLVIAFFVARYGYHSYYIDFSEVLSGSPLLYLISKLELLMESAFCIFLATLPSRRQFKKPVFFYVIFLFLTLGGGQRSSFLLGLMIIFIFLVYMNGIRPEERWYDRKYFVYFVIAFPIVAVSASLYNAWRFDNSITEVDFWKTFGNFFYEQGVTSYIVKRAYELEASIPPSMYSLEFFHSGVLAKVFGIEVYQGNTEEHALYGNSFTHALGYTIMGPAYLAGGGTGSSYIAELYYDFRYVGVVLGSMLYGWIFSKINIIENAGVVKRALIFICVSKIFWAIRASFTGFLSYFFAPTTIFLLLFVFVGSRRKVTV